MEVFEVIIPMLLGGAALAALADAVQREDLGEPGARPVEGVEHAPHEAEVSEVAPKNGFRRLGGAAGAGEREEGPRLRAVGPHPVGALRSAS